MRIVSFGYGHGDAPAAHLTLDLRHHFRDPHVSPAMRELTAVHREVRRTVLGTPGVKALLAATVRAVQAYDAGPSARNTVVALGCTGGRHRERPCPAPAPAGPRGDRRAPRPAPSRHRTLTLGEPPVNAADNLTAQHAELKAEITRTDTKTALLLAFVGAAMVGSWSVARDLPMNLAAYLVGGAGTALLKLDRAPQPVTA